MNQGRVEGNLAYEIIPFANGDDPTQGPVSRDLVPVTINLTQHCNQHDLPLLGSIDAIENLNGQELAGYLTVRLPRRIRAVEL